MLKDDVYYMNPATGCVDSGSSWMLDFYRQKEDENLSWEAWGGPSLTEVIKINNGWFEFDVALKLMDDEIRENLHNYKFSSDQDFINAYLVAHEIKFNEKFTI